MSEYHSCANERRGLYYKKYFLNQWIMVCFAWNHSLTYNKNRQIWKHFEGCRYYSRASFIGRSTVCQFIFYRMIWGVQVIVLVSKSTNGIGFWPMTLIMIVAEFLWIGFSFHPAVHVDVSRIHFRQSERNENYIA